ncbi:MAG: hypothetical protein FRX48_00742 [Lasallia pustulata]|uniref:Uncharacterized protein n=1 Tax=Lasallia pustulata TaxID=136370 RepID=A0A5M8Q4A1_9LECA|nr:MAG: hypothetical protein FRX48_00742 [Lasallia pustulata]
MPTHETTKRLRHEEKVAREQLVGHLPASIINTHFDTEKGYRNTRAVRAALAYIKELEAANLRLEVENGWLAEDVEELEEKLEESKLQNGVLQELLEKRTRADEEGTSNDEMMEGLDDVFLVDEAARDEAGEEVKG